MKKTLSLILAAFALSAFFTVGATAFSFPDDTCPIVRRNAETLYRELGAISEHSVYMGTMLFLAQTLCSVGMEEIVDINIELTYPSGGSLFYFNATIRDTAGIVYFMYLNEDGAASLIYRGYRYQYGELLWYAPLGTSILPLWAFWPPWLQCVVRVVFFGWIWMR